MEHSVSQADNVASRLEIFAAYLEATSKSLCVIISSAGAAWGLLMKVSLPLARNALDRVGRGNPLLLLACWRGAHFDRGLLDLRHSLLQLTVTNPE
jgi:hypothetical protein